MAANLVLSVITILFSLFFLFYSLQLPFGSLSNIGSGGYPSLILFLLLLVGIYLCVRTLIQMKAFKKESASQVQKEELQRAETSANVSFPYKHWIITIIIFFYVLAIPLIGFLVATPIVIFVIAFMLGMGQWIKLTTISIVSGIIFVIVFGNLLAIPLPKGVAFFRELSMLFY